MSVLAATRPESWNLPLFLHVFGAMLLLGATLTATSALAFAHGRVRLVRLGYRSLLAVALPGYVLMFVGGLWIYSREGLDKGRIESAWVAIGFVVAEGGLLPFIASLIAGGIGLRRMRTGGGSGLLKTTTYVTLALLAAYVFAVWAMTAKPD